MNHSLYLLGLCVKANALVSGDQILPAVRSNKAHLVIITHDASDRTRKQYKDKCAFYHIDVIESFSSFELSKAIGKTSRVACAVTHAALAKQIKEALKEVKE
jgi:ribosomal protein L7Ae-like RNA K-turn-binding protein